MSQNNLHPLAVSASNITDGSTVFTATRQRFARYFFAAMGIFFIVIAVTGFAPSYKAMQQGVLLPHWVVHLHGAVMTGWLFVYAIQAILAARGNLQYHKRLGIGAVFLGITVWGIMVSVSVHAIIAYRPPEQDFLFDLLLMEFYALASFGVLFTWGMLIRKKDPAAHKRLLTLATLVLLQAAVDRIHWLPGFGLGYPYDYFIYLDLLVLPLVLYDFITLRRIHRITWIGAVYIILLQLSVSAVWGSARWHSYWFAVTKPLMEKRIEVQLTRAQTDPLLGDYGNKDFHVSVIRENDTLSISVPGQPKLDLGATSATEFFMRTQSVEIIFVKAADGHVIKLVSKQGAGRDEFPRMNAGIQ